MHKPFVPVDKGKLPCETVSIQYDLEYGSAEIEMHKNSIKPGQKVVIIDDLMATGGTIQGGCSKLIEGMGGEVVKIVCLIELAGLKGRKRLEDYQMEAVIPIRVNDKEKGSIFMAENNIMENPYENLQNR